MYKFAFNTIFILDVAVISHQLLITLCSTKMYFVSHTLEKSTGYYLGRCETWIFQRLCIRSQRSSYQNSYERAIVFSQQFFAYWSTSSAYCIFWNNDLMTSFILLKDKIFTHSVYQNWVIFLNHNFINDKMYNISIYYTKFLRMYTLLCI